MVVNSLNEIVFESAARIHPEDNDGQTAADAFLGLLLSNQGNWLKYCKKNEPMIFNSVDKEKFENALKCSHCRIPFKNDDVKVRDHGKVLNFISYFFVMKIIPQNLLDHVTGRFLGAAHQASLINMLIY